MKFAIGVFVFLWLACGVTGAYQLGQLDSRHWMSIARGPFTLGTALSEPSPLDWRH